MPVGVNPRPPGAQAPSTGVDFLTPPDLLVALGTLRVRKDGEYTLGADPFDLDPCSSYRQPWPTARVMHTIYEDGTTRDWQGEVWLNPPYGKELYLWLARLATHGNGMALLYARTDTIGFGEWVWEKADAIYFFKGRLRFHAPVTGALLRDARGGLMNSGGPMCLACYGNKSVERARRLKDSDYPGTLVSLRAVRKGK